MGIQRDGKEYTDAGYGEYIREYAGRYDGLSRVKNLEKVAALYGATYGAVWQEFCLWPGLKL